MTKSIHLWNGKYLSRKRAIKVTNTYVLSKMFYGTKHRRKPTTEIKRMEEEIKKLERGTPQNNILKPIMDFMKEDKAKQT